MNRKTAFLGLTTISGAIVLALGLFGTGSASAAEETTPPRGSVLVNKDEDGVALHGYDPVAYFTDNKPVKGDLRFSTTYQGARYAFASAEHLRMFESEPARYAPAFGGYCGYAASIGKVRPADPRIWSIVDGSLILQHTTGAAELWARDISGNKARADRLWPRLIDAKAGKKNPVDGLLGRSVLKDLN